MNKKTDVEFSKNDGKEVNWIASEPAAGLTRDDAKLFGVVYQRECGCHDPRWVFVDRNPEEGTVSFECPTCRSVVTVRSEYKFEKEKNKGKPATRISDLDFYNGITYQNAKTLVEQVISRQSLVFFNGKK